MGQEVIYGPAPIPVPRKKNGAANTRHPDYWRIVRHNMMADATHVNLDGVDFLAIFRGSRKNAKQRGIPFELTEDQFAKIVYRAQGRCELSGIGFRAKSPFRRNPWLPSIDRIDCTKGYTFGNCRLVCAALNIAMNVWGLDVILMIADGVRSGGPTMSACTPEGTHHHACACREARFARMEAALLEVRGHLARRDACCCFDGDFQCDRCYYLALIDEALEDK